MRHVVPALFIALALGCAESHGPVSYVDGGGACTGGPAPTCVQSFDHQCGDSAWQASCASNGSWVCPPGTRLESEAECWCHGSPPGLCSCTPSGWLCGDLDAGPPPDAGGCPVDGASAEGTPCTSEGLSCGSCVPCGPCDLLICIGGAWMRNGTTARPGIPCLPTFPCGPNAVCETFAQYCEHSVSDVAGDPDGWICRPFPDTCATTGPSCACLPPADRCEGDASAGFTITWFGG